MRWRQDIAVDDSGNVYITGQAASTDFPTTTGAYAETHAADGGDYDTYVAKLSADGSSLVYSTFFGGDAYDVWLRNCRRWIRQCLRDRRDARPPICRRSMPTKVHSAAPRQDAFLLKLNASGTALLYSSYLGGTGTDYAKEIVLDPSGIVHIVGDTQSSDLSLKNDMDASLGGTQDVFVREFDLTQTGSASLVYSTYLGGSGTDSADGLAVDSSGNVYVSGNTQSTDFTTVNAYDSSHNLSDDIFLSKLDSAGSTLLYSTYIGGSGSDSNQGLAVDDSGNAYLAGYAPDGLPHHRGSLRHLVRQRHYDTVVAKFDTTLSGTSSWSTRPTWAAAAGTWPTTSTSMPRAMSTSWGRQLR